MLAGSRRSRRPLAEVMHHAFSALVARTRALPSAARYAGTLIVVVCMVLLRQAFDPILPAQYPYLLSFVAILISASLFDRGTGFLATALTAASAAYLYLPPVHSFKVETLNDQVGLALFVAVGMVMSAIIEASHRALADAQRAHAGLEQAHTELARAERARGLLLHEYRHRTRNDLASLAALLLLRARRAPSEAAKEGLREAAEHATVLARVHTRLAPSEGIDRDATTVDTQMFIAGLCEDLEKVLAGDGLRPVALIVEAEPHSLDTERGVQLGLVLNEAVTNALKYGFPEDRAGTVRVYFRREEHSFVLTVADDGVGISCDEDMDPIVVRPQGTGLGTRLLRALAAQLRGTFTRRPTAGGDGTVAELHFPVKAPGLLHR